MGGSEIKTDATPKNCVMGPSISKVQSKHVVDAITRGVIKNVQNCPRAPNLANVIRIEGDSNQVQGIVQQLDATFTSNCWFQADNQQDLVTDIVQEILTEAQAQSSLFGGLYAETNIDTETLTKAVTEALTENLQDCSGPDGEGGNAITIRGNFNEVNGVIQAANYNTVMDCYFSAANVQDLVTKIEQDFVTSARSGKKAGISPLGILMNILIIMAVIGGGIAVLKLATKGSGGKSKKEKGSSSK